MPQKTSSVVAVAHLRASRLVQWVKPPGQAGSLVKFYNLDITWD
jgi:hypothetical protein